MAGQLVRIGRRWTYFPPFVNERFDPVTVNGHQSFWSCTYAALLNGVNVAFLGSIPVQDHTEVMSLATASGDPAIHDGSTSDQMLQAFNTRFGQHRTLSQLFDHDDARDRLGSGWALVTAVQYGLLPQRLRRWAPGFQGGHRVTLVGFDGHRSRILDPLANKPDTFAGEWIDFDEFWPAHTPGLHSLWFREGSDVPPPSTATLRTFAPVRRLTIAAGTTVRAWDAARPGMPVTIPFAVQGTARFAALVRVTQPQPGILPHGTFIQALDGPLAGFLVSPRAPGLTAGILPDVPVPGPAAGPADPGAAAVGPDQLDDVAADGAQPAPALEIDRGGLDAASVSPAPPAGKPIDPAEALPVGSDVRLGVPDEVVDMVDLPDEPDLERAPF